QAPIPQRRPPTFARSARTGPNSASYRGLSLVPTITKWVFVAITRKGHGCFALLPNMSAEDARKRWELENNVAQDPSIDQIYYFSNEEQQKVLSSRPWSKEYVVALCAVSLPLNFLQSASLQENQNQCCCFDQNGMVCLLGTGFFTCLI
ncbi:hypothetical protein HK096_011342, partial [Nowakowskiella sp. JEL0078]